MKNLFLGFTLFLNFSMYSQHEIAGSVYDATSGEPVIGATVVVQQTENFAVTDVFGKFVITEVPGGNFTLVISSLPYETKTVQVKIPSEELTIELFPTAIEIEEVIISTPFHRLQSENVMKVERVTMEQLDRSANISLSEGLSEIAGVENMSTGAGIGKPVIRGLSSNRVLVYTQGVRLENQQFGGEHGLGVSSSGVESVEVIKGPASLLYGSDALGGVLYLNPERYAPADSSLVEISTRYTTNTRGLGANAAYKTSGEDLQFLIRGDYSAHSDYRTGNGKRVTNSRFNEFDLKSGIGYRSDNYRGDLRYNFNSSDIGIPEGIGVQTPSKDVEEPYQSVQNHILSLDNNYYFRNSSLDFKVGYLFNNRKEYEGHHEHEHESEHEEEEHPIHAEAEPALEMHLETFNYDLKYNVPKRGKLETILGVQGMHQVNRNFAEEILIPDATTFDFGLMATTHYHLEEMDFQGGLRYDHRMISTEEAGLQRPSLQRSFNSYTGALGAKIELFENLSTRINLATGFRAPNLAELTSYGSHHGSNRFEIGNPDLQNEQNYQLDLAVEFRNEHFEGFVNGFYNNINDYIYLQPTGEILDENPVFVYRQNNAVLYGGEAGIHIHPHPLDWLHVESSYEMVIGERESGENLPLIPVHSFLNTLRLEFRERNFYEDAYATLSVKTVLDQDEPGTFETPTPGYSLLNAGLGGSFYVDNLLFELQFSGNNLLDKTYISHLSRLKPDGIPNIGRNLSVSLKAIF